MTRNLKALGLALVAISALGAALAQSAAATDAHQFKSDGDRTILTGTGETPTTITVGAAGTVSCAGVILEGTTDAGFGQTEVDEITLTPTYSNCTFGGKPATVFMNHCAYVLDTDTTEGNSTGGKHANVVIECAAGHKIQIHTANCTVTIGAQTVSHEVTYANDTGDSFTITATGHGIVVGKERNTATQPVNGCLLFPTGAVGKAAGSATIECFRDDSLPQPNPTTPSGTIDNQTTGCEITGV